jgi:hypothetical protein
MNQKWISKDMSNCIDSVTLNILENHFKRKWEVAQYFYFFISKIITSEVIGFSIKINY